MNRHIENQTAALRRVCVFRPRAERVATERLKSDREANLAIIDQCFGLLIGRVETTHEANLERHLRARHSFLCRPGLGECQSQGFFAENRFARLSGRNDKVMMGTGWCGDNDCIQLRQRQ